MRYIITRPCLSQGQLQILKYLQPYFPADGQVTFQDSRGDRFLATVEAAPRRLTGLGELYHAHHLGVNDVLLLTPRPDGVYGVECVVKPHARPAAAAPAPTPPVPQKRVVIHATPHVREVRMERVNAPEAPAAPPQPSMQQPTAPQPSMQQTAATQKAAPEQNRPTQAGQLPDRKAEQPAQSSEAAPASRSVPLLPLANPPQANRPADTFSDTRTPPAARALTAEPPTPRATPSALHQSALVAPPVSVATTPMPHAAQKAAAAVAEKPAAVQQAASPVSRSVTVPVAVPPTPDPLTTEQQLVQLAKLTGYAAEHLGGSVMRLRANLGAQSYSVLLALTPEGLKAPAWQENADYKALLTAEDERPQGVARFTQAALTSLLEHAQLAPLSPVDLRGYWNTGSFDYRSVESVAELVSAHLAQRGIFSHVLMTLAQQPAHSLVQVTRLAERLGSGVNTAELQSILETLSRPPFMALTPLPDGQFYLRGDVRDLLGEVGEYTEGMRRRLK